MSAIKCHRCALCGERIVGADKVLARPNLETGQTEYLHELCYLFLLEAPGKGIEPPNFLL